jgi:predicted nucleic acid-binding Zn ribbon protein
MPTYVYRFIDTDETIEVQQAFTDDSLTHVKHPQSGKKMKVKKVFTPVGVTFRGGGFYKTDSRGGSSKSSASTSSNGDSGSSADKSSSDKSSNDKSSSDKTSSTTSTDSGSSTTASKPAEKAPAKSAATTD